MIKELLTIRCKQTARNIVGIGSIRMIFLFVLVVFIGFTVFKLCEKESNAQYLGFGVLLMLSLIQLNRKDKLFLQSHFYNHKQVVFFEYLLLLSPILLCMFFYGHWTVIMEMLLGILIVIHLGVVPRVRKLNTKLQDQIPNDCIEWKAGGRKFFFVLVPVWFLGVTTSFFVGSVPIAIFTIGILSYSFYERCEPYQMLQALELNPRRLILSKITKQIMLFSALTFPMVILFVIFHSALWYIPVIEYSIFLFLHAYSIVTKYAFFSSNEVSQAGQTFRAVGLLAGLIPGLLPVVWVLTIFFYIKSIKKLDLYLNDFN